VSDFTDEVEMTCFEDKSKEVDAGLDAIAGEVITERVRELLSWAYMDAVQRLAVHAEITRPKDDIQVVAADVHTRALDYTRWFASRVVACLVLLGMEPTPEDARKAYYRLRHHLDQQKGK